MMPQAAPLHPADAQRQAMLAPVSFWEWFSRKYPPDLFEYRWQYYFATIKPASSAASTTANLNVQVALWAFSFRSFFWLSSSGAAPSFPYRVGIALLSGNDWTFGQWASQVVTGNGGAYDFPFAWPREVIPSTQLTVTINNALNSSALEGDAGIVGIQPLQRSTDVHQAMGI